MKLANSAEIAPLSASLIENDMKTNGEVQDELIQLGETLLPKLTASVTDGAANVRLAAKLLGIARPDIAHDIQLVLKHIVLSDAELSHAVGKTNYVSRVVRQSAYALNKVCCFETIFAIL